MPTKKQPATTRKATALPLELPLENSIGYQLRHADRAVEATLQNRLAAHRVPIGMWFYLRVLWMKDGLTQTALSHRVRATTATTALQLAKMEERGFIRREFSKDDKRHVYVYLTPEARALEKVLMQEAMQTIADATSGLTQEEIDITMRVLHQIRNNLKSSGSG